MESSYQRRMDEIAKRPASQEVFGAHGKSGHHFVLTRHSKSEVAHLEDQLGVCLPEEYAQFLIEVGSGAGPSYGLFSPAKMLDEIRNLNSDLEKGTHVPSPNAVFPLHESDAREIRRRLDNHDPDPFAEAGWLCDGCVPICFHGCTFWTALVTAGKLCGTVWDVACYEGTDGQWLPASRPTGVLNSARRIESLPALPSPPTFLQWYASWLERVETELPDQPV
jgi:hypothetical protein